MAHNDDIGTLAFDATFHCKSTDCTGSAVDERTEGRQG